jgi:AcrR family transcriptional regulator
LRKTLLSAGLELLAEGSPEALTLREVARRAGVSHAAPYRHFESKEVLLGELATQGFEALASSMEEAQRGHREPLDRLRRSGVGYVRFAMAHPAHLRLMFKNTLGDQAPTELVKAGDRAFGILADAVAACQKAGVLPSGDPTPMAWTCWSLVHGLSMLMLDHALDPLGVSARHIDKATTTALDYLLRGMLVR